MPDGKADPEMPFVVVTDKDVILSGHETAEVADTRAARANTDAETLGIPTRYHVEPNPNSPKPYHPGA